jgi:hypothetical protein
VPQGICSYCAFIVYGYLGALYPVLALHLILLPLNGFRLYEMRKGDTADAMFFVVSGRYRLEELDMDVLPGQVVGELGLWRPARHGRRRWHAPKTAKCFRSLTTN